jgi:hypothetical protein
MGDGEMKRETGYYWVRTIVIPNEWQPAFYDQNDDDWLIHDKLDLLEIHEIRIKNPDEK